MNIFFAADVSIKKVIGGAERVLHEQTARLSKKGHEIHVITRRLPIHASPYENIKNVHEWRYDINKKNTFTFLVSTVLNCQKLYKRISQQTSFDLINLHQPFSAFTKSSGTTMFIVAKKVILMRKFLSKYKKKAKVGVLPFIQCKFLLAFRTFVFLVFWGGKLKFFNLQKS